MLFPPLIESTIWVDEETLLGWWGLCKGVAHIRAKHEEVFGGVNCVKESRASLIDSVGVDLVKHLDGS
jgi:hypothetical protein